MGTPRIRLAATTALAVVACGMTACSGSGTSSTTTTAPGGTTAEAAQETTPAVELTIGTDDSPGTPGADQVEHFATEVAELSDGAIAIDPKWHAAGDVKHWDQAVAGMVTHGDLDLGMVPARSWDAVGVTSLRALSAPFLVTSDTLLESVLDDGDLVAQLTSGLPDAGATALGLYPEGLRHPFGYQGPLRGAADYRGGVVRMAWSRTQAAMFRALGATTSDDEPDPVTMIGGDSSYRLSPTGIATGNVVFYPKVNVLAARADLRDDLTDEQWSTLQAAADATGAWVRDELPTDAEAAAKFCQQAGRIVAASPAQVRSLVDATRGVVDDLREDPTTAAVIDAVERLKSSDQAPGPVTACPEKEAGDEAAVNGTYVFTVTPEAARDAGTTDEAAVAFNTGDFRVTFADGTWSMHQVMAIGEDAGQDWDGSGGYTMTGRRLKWFWGQGPGEWTEMDVAVSKEGLTFSAVDDGDADPNGQTLADAMFTTWKRQDG